MRDNGRMWYAVSEKGNGVIGIREFSRLIFSRAAFSSLMNGDCC